jgi:hypothetical protein
MGTPGGEISLTFVSHSSVELAQYFNRRRFEQGVNRVNDLEQS